MIGIYKITSPSKRIYIGQSIDIDKRKTSYINKHQYALGPKIYNSINKHGWDKHQHKVIEECSLEQLNERETYWKQYYIDQYGWEKMLFCELHDNGGGSRSEEVKQKISINSLGKNSIIIHQFNLDGEYIKQWDSIVNAENIYGKGIKDNLANKILTSGGYIWSYNNNVPDSNYINKVKNKYSSLRTSVLQFTLDGNIIKEWGSIIEIEREYNFKNSNISAVCGGKQKTAYGYKWAYKNNV